MSAEDKNARIPDDVVTEEFYIALQRAYRALREKFLTRRETRDITQQMLADRLGWDKALVSRRLHGRANLTFKTMSALATAMDCRLNVEFIDYNHMASSNYCFDGLAEQPSSPVTLATLNQPSGSEEVATTPRSLESLRIRPTTGAAA